MRFICEKHWEFEISYEIPFAWFPVLILVDQYRLHTLLPFLVLCIPRPLLSGPGGSMQPYWNSRRATAPAILLVGRGEGWLQSHCLSSVRGNSTWLSAPAEVRAQLFGRHNSESCNFWEPLAQRAGSGLADAEAPFPNSEFWCLPEGSWFLG